MVQIRQIEQCDNEEVKELVNAIMNGDFAKENKSYNYQDLDDIPRYYGGARDLFLVAEKDNKILGTVAIKEDSPDVALLRRVMVHHDCRGKGYGKMLMQKAIKFCFDNNYKTVTFRGSDRMREALQLCLKNGFEENDVSELGGFKLMLLSKKLQE